MEYLQFSLIYRCVCAMDFSDGKDFTPSFSISLPLRVAVQKTCFISRVSFALTRWKMLNGNFHMKSKTRL